MKVKLFATAFILMMSIFTFTALGEENYGYGYIDHNGNVVIKPQYDYAYSFSEGRARVFTGTISRWGSPDEGKYGFIDKTGNMLIDFKYDEATDFKNGISLVKKNGKYGAIDPDGNVVVEFKYDYMAMLGDNIKAFVGTLNDYGSPKNGMYEILTPNGKSKFSIKCQSIYSYEGYYEAYNGSKYAIVAENGNKLTDYIWESLTAESKNTLGYKNGDKYGYIDINGNIIISAQYDSIGSFVDGQAIVRKNGTYYLIDKYGKVLVKYKADYVGTTIVNGCTYAFEGTVSSYNLPEIGKYYLMSVNGDYLSSGYVKGDCYSIDKEKLAWRIKDGLKWGIVNLQGETIFPFTECDRLYYCGEDIILEKNDKYALADSNGKLKTEYIYDNMTGTDEDLIAVSISKIEPDFRKTRWGMSIDEVKQLEGQFPDYSGKLDGKNATYIGYDTTLMGNSVIVAFYFGQNGLYEARYIWTEKHSNENLYISDYNSVKEQITKKYGTPLIDNEDWDTSSHKSYYSDRKGDALSYGYLSYYTWYYLGRTDITMIMNADNYNISFIIYYESNTINAPEEDYSDQF